VNVGRQSAVDPEASNVLPLDAPPAGLVDPCLPPLAIEEKHDRYNLRPGLSLLLGIMALNDMRTRKNQSFFGNKKACPCCGTVRAHDAKETSRKVVRHEPPKDVVY
jgi:hypothetical protein